MLNTTSFTSYLTKSINSFLIETISLNSYASSSPTLIHVGYIPRPLSGCLKHQIVLNPIYNMFFSYVYLSMINFNLYSK